MRVSSFKAQYRHAPLRSATPPPPSYEPLSPVLLPSIAVTANPAGGKDNIAERGSIAGHAVVDHTLVHGEPAHSRLQLDSPAVTYDPPLRSAPLPHPAPQRSPSLRSPIDALANAAATPSHTSPTQLDSAQHRPHVPISPTTIAGPSYPFTDRPPSQAYRDGIVAPNGERPSKRARSEFFPSPQAGPRYHSRPSTSHISQWSYNLEQMVDNGLRMYHDSHAPLHSDDNKRLSDAQLLLDFHNAVSTSPGLHAHAPATKRCSISYPQALQSDALQTVDFSSPRLGGTIPEHGRFEQKYSKAHYEQASSTVVLPAPSLGQPLPAPAVQTHTPPEDPLGTINSLAGEGMQNVEGKRSKKPQGWPKGRSRGHRAGPPTSKKKRSTPRPKGTPSSSTLAAPDQLQSPQSLPEGTSLSVPRPRAASQDIASQVRRHSCSTTFASAQDFDAFSTPSRARSVPLQSATDGLPPPTVSTAVGPLDHGEELGQTTICAGCNSFDSRLMIGDGEQWISCDGCKGWFHYVCAGFKSEREVREIDKFYCDGCKPRFGNTTKVRKSGRAHTAVDYAGLNEGILKTSDDNPEHHYIQAFKTGDIHFTPETFARLPPECVNADFFEKMDAFREPVVIPASANPRPTYPSTSSPPSLGSRLEAEEEPYGYEMVPDDGQDQIDMVIPDGLTVRRVSELYGPHERVPVIDVKAQEGEDKRWTMAKWADYYEQQGEKPVRNVISLEVSRSKLGKLIRRPKVVRDMDLQDSIWPEEDKANAPPVQFYCLMSVADCYTDFHIDFGGSSVYYHIVKGRKTFFFIPPTKSNLKKYEDWCLSPRQSHEFLGQQVKDCYRVDLYPGDTMLIPSGWIHAVWTPEDSLVIGGNYLTRIHYGMQIRVLEIEKNTKVAAKFRYPFFQKIMWLSLLRYLEDDPLPRSVEEMVGNGGQFDRVVPIYCEPESFGHNSRLGAENYNRRYYPKAELDGLPDLVNYIWRTVMISLGRIDGVTQVVRNAVTRSIPKGHGEPLVLAKRFATWVAWKRGNENIPQWAHLDAPLPEAADPRGDKKISAAQAKRLEREALREVLKATTPRNIRTRGSDPSPSGATDPQTQEPSNLPGSTTLPMTGFLRPSREHVTTPKTSQLGPKRIACDACRKRRIRCKHKDDLIETPRAGVAVPEITNGAGSGSGSPATSTLAVIAQRRESDAEDTSAIAVNLIAAREVRTVITGTPISTEINPEAWANKSNRIKACPDCRKSKRRCIHDEYGNIDPIKASEIPVPRGSASKKRRASGDNDEGEAINKKMKRDSFAGLINGEVSHYNRYPLARPLSQTDGEDGMAAASAQQALDLSLADEAVPIDPQLFGEVNGSSHEVMASGDLPSRDTVISSVEELPDAMEGVEEANPIDPQLLNPEPRTPGPFLNGNTDGLNGANYVQVSPFAPAVQSVSPGHLPVSLHGTSSEHPHSAGANTNPRRKSQTPHSTKRISSTPKSSRGLRNGTIKVEPRSESKPRAMSSIESKVEDTASLALAMQLQMEEHGLRRRSK